MRTAPPTAYGIIGRWAREMIDKFQVVAISSTVLSFVDFGCHFLHMPLSFLWNQSCSSIDSSYSLVSWFLPMDNLWLNEKQPWQKTAHHVTVYGWLLCWWYRWLTSVRLASYIQALSLFLLLLLNRTTVGKLGIQLRQLQPLPPNLSDFHLLAGNLSKKKSNQYSLH